MRGGSAWLGISRFGLDWGRRGELMNHMYFIFIFCGRQKDEMAFGASGRLPRRRTKNQERGSYLAGEEVSAIKSTCMLSPGLLFAKVSRRCFGGLVEKRKFQYDGTRAQKCR